MNIGKQVGALASVVGLTVALGIGTALPASAAGGADVTGADVTQADGCRFAGPDGVTVVRDPTARLQLVITPSGHATLTCHGQLPASIPAPSQTIILSGFGCFTTRGVTTQTQETITPSGQVELVCQQ